MSDTQLEQTAAPTLQALELGGSNTAPSFVDGGYVTAADLVCAGYASKVQVLPDGRLLLMWQDYAVGYDVTVACYGADGQLDTSFGNGGTLQLGDPLRVVSARQVVVQPDGGFLVVGDWYDDVNGVQSGLMRFTADGQPDLSFGTDGLVALDGESYWYSPQSVDLAADGSIIVTGILDAYPDPSSLVAFRFLGDGTADPAFGTGGMVLLDGDGFSGSGATLLPDGSFLVAGTDSVDGSFALRHYHADGSLDASFSGAAGLPAGFGLSFGAVDVQWVAQQVDGSILVVGEVLDGVTYLPSVVVVRYAPDGALDASFGEGGIVVTDLAGGSEEVAAILVQADGKVVVAGAAHPGSETGWNPAILLLRYNADGTLDGSFGNGGVVLTDLADGWDGAFSLAEQADGKLVVLGDTSAASGGLVLLRYNVDGSLDASFNSVDTLAGGVSENWENSFGQALDPDVRIYDAELDAANDYGGSSLTLSRQGGAQAEDVFVSREWGLLGPLLEGEALLLDGIAVGTVTTNSGGTLVLSFAAGCTGEQVEQVMRQLAYTNSSETPPASVQIDWVFSDGNTGAQGSGGALSASGSTLVTINAINDAPVAIDAVVSLAEDSSHVFTLADFPFSDAEGDALQGVYFTQVPAGGSLRLDGVAVSAGQSVSAADIVAGKLVFTPAPNASGTYTLGFKVSDGEVQSVQPASVQIQVSPVNDAPTTTSGSVGLLEDQPYALKAADFRFADVDGDALASVTITTLPAAGSLSLNGVAVVAGQSIAASAIAAGQLLFTPAANANGTGYASLGYQVSDGQALSAGGTLSFNVSPVNDAPTTAGGSVTLQEDTPRAFTLTDFPFSDVDGNSLASVTITTLPAAGSLKLNGVAVTAGQSISAAAIAACQLVFTPAANASGAAYASLGFKVSDGALSSAVATLSIAVNPVNDAPTSANRQVSTLEDTPYVLSQADFAFADVDGDSLAAVTIVTLPAAGSLKLDGVALSAGQSVALADIVAGRLVFTPAPDANGSAYASFGFRVSDGNALSATTHTLTVDVTPVDDTYTINGTAGRDTLTGDQAGAGSMDLIYGLAGDDSLSGLGGNDLLDGGAGIDAMNGGSGNDTYVVDNSKDTVTESSSLATEIDTVQSSIAYTLGSNLENLVLTGSSAIAGTGNALANSISGNGAANVLSGNGGNDVLSGGGGNDTLVGGLGLDTLTGGAGADVFDFNALGELGTSAGSTDIISDFTSGVDRIDLSTIDANSGAGGNNAFSALIGAGASFSAAGQLRLTDGVLYGNTDADADAEFAIVLTGVSSLSLADFVL